MERDSSAFRAPAPVSSLASADRFCDVTPSPRSPNKSTAVAPESGAHVSPKTSANTDNPHSATSAILQPSLTPTFSPSAAQDHRRKSNSGRLSRSIDDDDDDLNDDDDDDDDDVASGDGGGAMAAASHVQGLYDAADYEHLAVSESVRQLFAYITSYAPSSQQLPFRLQPFVPDYVPAVGDIDAFVRVPRPDGAAGSATSGSGGGGDGKGDQCVLLGLSVLDEPCGEPSDRHLLQLRLQSLSRAVADTTGAHHHQSPPSSSAPGVSSATTGGAVADTSGGSGGGLVTQRVHSASVSEVAQLAIGGAARASSATARAIDKWVRGVHELHSGDAPSTVHYTRPMPDLDYLMQEWPGDIEDALTHASATGSATAGTAAPLQLPSADLDCDLATYVDIVCALLDIPVHPESRLHSLHMLFSLYAAFRQSAHFAVHQMTADDSFN